MLFKSHKKLEILNGFIAGAVSSAIVSALFFSLLIVNHSNFRNFFLAPINKKHLTTKVGNNLQQNNKEKQEQELNSNSIVTQESQVVDVVEKVDPAVVSIIISKDVPIIERYYDNTPDNNPFGDLFGGGLGFNFNLPKYRETGKEKKEIGGGTGFFISADGLIITNKHVVEADDVEYTVLTNDGKKHDAKVVAKDPVNDIAIIKITGKDFTFLDFADSDKLKVGQTTIAIGNALGEFRNTVSVGVISGLARSITAGSGFGDSELLEGVIQTDAAINRGNSGGPLLNLKGEVVGVNVAMADGSQNIGFALPANLVKTVVDSVKKDGKITRPFLGVRYVLITPEIKDKNKLMVDYGALVVRGETREELAVMPGSAADKAGIEENDIILEVDNVKLDGTKSLSTIINQHQVGDKVKFKLLHKGEEKVGEVILQEMPN